MKTLASLAVLSSVTISGLSLADQDFGPPLNIPGTPGQDAEPPSLATSGKNVFVLWHQFAPGETQPDVYLARSTDRGKTFAARVNLSNTGPFESSGERIATSGNRVYVVWSENADEIVFSRSTNNGGSFATPVALANAAEAVEPALLASGDDVYVAWTATGPSGDTDIFFAESDDRGQTFSDEVNISNNAGRSEHPTLALSGDHVIVAWRDGSLGAGFQITVARGE
ncbi:MAG TPA: sialidase family protein [Polyangiaceae bacterium]|nr:sialidase family protein [Polyangiaceae bacterium]